MARQRNASDVRIAYAASYWIRDIAGNWHVATQEMARVVMGSPKGGPAKVRAKRKRKDTEVDILAVSPPDYTSLSDAPSGIRLWTWDLGAVSCGKVWSQIGQYVADDVRRSELTGSPTPRYVELYTQLGERLCGYPGVEGNPKGRKRNTSARREHRDLLTGERVRPGTPGSMGTGEYVMRLRPAPGEPFQTVEVDRDDLDPAKDTFGVGKEVMGKYRGHATAKAKALARELKRMPTFEKGQDPRVPGARSTFSSPTAAAKEFLSHNTSLSHLGWADVGDAVEDWMDRNEAHTRRGRHKALDETPRGREILDLFQTGRNDQGMRELLAYLFGQAPNRRWDGVAWNKVEEIVDIFAQSADREATRTGETDFLVGGMPRIEWMPPATGFHESTKHFVESLPKKGREYYRRYDASRALYVLADTLDNSLKRNKRCLSADERAVVRARIKTIRRWAKRPDEMPEWVCASFREPAEICDLLGIEAEVAKLDAACDSGYDPSWPTRPEGLVRPGLGVLPSAAALAPAPVEDLDLPWESNPRRLRERLKRW